MLARDRMRARNFQQLRSMESQLDTEFRDAEEEFINDSRVESSSESIDYDTIPDTSVAAAQPRPPVDDEVSAYLARGCGCKKNDGRPCQQYFQVKR